MPRKNRKWYEGASYHIMARGNRRSSIFRDHEDYVVFLKMLVNVKDKIGFGD